MSDEKKSVEVKDENLSLVEQMLTDNGLDSVADLMKLKISEIENSYKVFDETPDTKRSLKSLNKLKLKTVQIEYNAVSKVFDKLRK